MSAIKILKTELERVTLQINKLILEKKKIEKAISVVKMLKYEEIKIPKKTTIKDMIKISFSEHFKDGATSRELLIYCKSRFPDRFITRASFTPQLSRLRQAGIIKLENKSF